MKKFSGQIRPGKMIKIKTHKLIGNSTNKIFAIFYKPIDFWAVY